MIFEVMLDFHMERAHGKRQENALCLTRKEIETNLYSRDRSTSRARDQSPAEESPKPKRRPVAKYEPIEAKKYECPECGQKFVSERAQQIHLSTMHEKTTKDHKKCPPQI